MNFNYNNNNKLILNNYLSFIHRAKARETNKAIFTLPEKLDKKWDEMNIARLMKVLMSMKMVDPKLLALWTKPEKDRIAYNVQKQKAIEESFRRVSEDMATLRARLLPTAQSVEDRDEFVRIQLNQLNVMCIDDGSGDSIEKTILNERDTFSKILQHAEEFVNHTYLASYFLLIELIFLCRNKLT